MPRRFLSILCALLAALSAPASSGVPEDFPAFHVPGAETEMRLLRELFWLHYPGGGPKSTLWDEWLSHSALWPAVTNQGFAGRFRTEWSQTLSQRILDSDGYVATHQHASIAHQLGWPFPFYHQGQGGFGWHFSFHNTVGPPWRGNDLSSAKGWTLANVFDAGTNEIGWRLLLTNALASVTTPPMDADSFNSPFVQIRWAASNLTHAAPVLYWTTDRDPEFSPDRCMQLEIPSGRSVHYTMVPVYRHPGWSGRITRLRLELNNSKSEGEAVLQALFSNYDTRHNINSQNYIRGCANYFWWTGDIAFLRAQINRMRTALRYVMTEHRALERNVVDNPWVGHDGRPGFTLKPDGSKKFAYGHGVGNNYWDLLPFGGLDCYATIHYYDALGYLAKIEAEIAAHPEWQVPRGALAFEPEFLSRHREEVKATGNRLFWNRETQRLVACIDADGNPHDYGFTFLNLEAVHYGFATPEHAAAIMDWIDGRREVASDTSKGADIYSWRFGPRATTKRNVDWYMWAWSGPETIPFGGQVQDGGAVLGFAYFDLMSRLRVLGPDNAWKRLQETLRWFQEVQTAGGYRKYYDGKRPGTLQGGGTAGGLGLDHEFFESLLVPQVMLYGFLGFTPEADGFALNPRLPAAWPELHCTRIAHQGGTYSIRAGAGSLEVRGDLPAGRRFNVRLPSGDWTVTAEGTSVTQRAAPSRNNAVYRIEPRQSSFTISFSRKP